MLRFPALLLDHDDTAVRSTPTVNYPAFLLSLQTLRPDVSMTEAEYMRLSYRPGFFRLCREILHYSDEEFDCQAKIWREYARTHCPPAYPGIAALLRRQRAEGGLIFVVSHSENENIRRDYRVNFGLQPDDIFACDLPEACWKPSPYAIKTVLRSRALTPGQLLVVDDLLPGCEMAHACGVRFAAAGWSQTVPDLAADLRRRSEYYCETVGALSHLLFD